MLVYFCKEAFGLLRQSDMAVPTDMENNEWITSQLSSMICSICLQASFFSFLIYQHFSPFHQPKEWHPQRNVENCYLTSPQFIPCFTFSLANLLISLSVCLRLTTLLRLLLKAGLNISILFWVCRSNPHIHMTPPCACQRCPSPLTKGCCWDFILPLPSQLKQFFSFPLSSCNHSLQQMRPPTHYFSIDLHSINRNTGHHSKMTLKKSLSMLYNITLQEDDLASDLLKQVPFSQLREVVFMYYFGKTLKN